MQPQTFKKQERLSNRKIIDELFSKGKGFIVSPLRVKYVERALPTEHPAQVLIAVSKRKHKKAYKRNAVKRRLREAYRKNKHILYDYLEQNNRQCALLILYRADELLSYQEIEAKIIVILKRLVREYEKTAG
ncbi:MAG: ribonuclease P protein component [Bacteroidales bacterium]|nr:ribonuclease P protein component [Bacteroidales bacterium]